jgi:hypothetical protein
MYYATLFMNAAKLLYVNHSSNSNTHENGPHYLYDISDWEWPQKQSLEVFL